MRRATLVFYLSCMTFRTCFPQEQVVAEDNGNCNVTKKCPEHWVRLNTEKCFRIYSDPMSQKEGKRVCRQQGARLASIHSSEEIEFLEAYAIADLEISSCFRIGGVRKGTTFLWEDLTPFDFSAWRQGLVKPRKQDCLLICMFQEYLEAYPSGEMVDWDCVEKFPIICQKFLNDI